MFPLKKFQDYLHQHALLQPGQKVLLTVSGGRDSVLLVHLCKQAGLNFGIAHCNFNLRGAEAQRDEDFVQALAIQVGAPYYVTHFDTRAYAAEQGISTQMAARTLRYQWFEEIRVSAQYDCIAVAHHQTDAIETVLLNLTRGTGIAGLHGILPKRGHIIRPLLFLSREDIDAIVHEEQLVFVEDGSNASDHYARNKIRLHVIPQLKALNPQLEHTFEQNISRFRDTELVLQQVVARHREELCRQEGDLFLLSLEGLMKLQPAALLLHELLRPYHFEEPVVRDILRSLSRQSGLSFYSASHRATLNRGQLIISPRVQGSSPVLSIEAGLKALDTEQGQLLIREGQGTEIQKVPHQAYVDADKLVYPLTLRAWEIGDRFIPLGMRGFKKVSDFLIDQKVPLPLKGQVLLLVNGNGEIIWVAGMRTDNRYKVTSATKKVTIFEVNSRMGS